LQEAANESVDYQIQVWAKSEQESLAEVEKAGVKIIRPDKSLFSSKVEPLYESYKKDKEKYELIESIRNYGIEE
jgi:TRAP-type C4-dicarboxylate transport system substrate-binding protein